MIETLRAWLALILCFAMVTTPLQAPASGRSSPASERSFARELGRVAPRPVNTVVGPLQLPANQDRTLKVGRAQSFEIAALRANRIDQQRQFQSYSGQTSTILPDGQTLLLGGRNGIHPVATAFINNPNTGAVIQLAQRMQHARFGHSATVQPDGTVLILGGIGIDGNVQTIAELFDPSSLTFTTISTPGITPRAFHTSTLLTDGRVLIAGGLTTAGDVVGLLEFWDPKSMLSRPSESELIVARGAHTGTLQPDGSVLFWGGVDSHGSVLEYGEVYDPTSRSIRMQATLPAIDNSGPPMVEASNPSDGEDNVHLDTLIAVRFSRPLSVETVNADTLALTSPEGNVRAKAIPAEGGMLAFVRVPDGLAGGTTYTISLSNETDRAGTTLTSATISFTTAGPSSSGQLGSNSESSAPKANPFDSPWRKLPPLLAPPGVTAVSGQALQLNGRPLANVTLKVGDQSTRSDGTGRFLVQNIEKGHQVLVIEGQTANGPRATYGLFEVGVDIVAGQTKVLNYKIWMTALDTAHAVPIPSPTVVDTTITTPLLPGLKLILPPKTVIYDHYGHVVHKVDITPIPVNRPPFPLPRGVPVSIYFTIQPGGAYLRVAGDNYPRGARLIYPNSANTLPGTRFAFWNYDADKKGWYVYGMGATSPDRREVIPNPGVSIYEFTGAMVGDPGPAPGSGPHPGGPKKGDPVDLSTGLFVYQRTDLSLPDVLPLSVRRTYRPGDTVSRDFGLGTTHNFQIYVIGDTFPYTYQDLILPDGGRIHYVRVSSGTYFTDAVYEATSTDIEFYGSTIFWNGRGWNLRFKNGTVWTFPDSFHDSIINQAAIISIQDRFGNLVSIARNSSNGNITQIISPNGRWLQFTYNSNNNINQITDNTGKSVTYTYDTNTPPRLTGVSVSNGGGSTTYNYGENGATPDEMTSIIDARGIKYLQNFYDSNGRISKQILANSGTYLFSYTTDQYGNVTQTNVTDPNTNVDVSSFSTPDPFPDGFQTGGYLTKVVSASGKTEQQTFTYDHGTLANNPGEFLLNLTDPLSRVTHFTYDALGNLTSVTRLSGTSSAATSSYTYEPTFSRVSTATDPLGNTMSYAYNDATNQVTVTNPTGNASVISEDTQGRLISFTDPLQESTMFSYTGADLTAITDPLRNTTNFLYDGEGRVITTFDPLGNATHYAYDVFSDVLGITDPLGNTGKFTYDLNQNLTSFTDPLHTATPAVYTPNSMDQLQTRTDPLGHLESYGYDGNGNSTCYTDRNGNISVLQYDGINRRTVAGYGAGSCTATTFASSITYGYDGGNRLKTANDSASGLITRNYDGLDSLQSEATTLAGTNHTVTYQNDSDKRRISMTVDSQQPVIYSYDAASRVKQITQGTAGVSFTYDAVGRRTSMTLPNSVVAQYTYDADSHLTGIIYQLGATLLGNLTYAYDADGRITQKGGSFAATNLPAALSSATYNADNQLTVRGGTSYGYDLNGNLKTDGTNTYTWDNRNQLGSITVGTAAAFQYDAFGRRIGKTLAGITTTLLYDDYNITEELSSATTTATLLTALTIDETYSRTDSSGPRYFLSDLLGSTIALSDSGGVSQTQFTYDPFGNTTSSGAASANPYQFAGRENDATGLYFNRARYYDPAVGRFISEDPIGLAGGINVYAYAYDNPTNLSDSTGLEPPAGHWWQSAGGAAGMFVDWVTGTGPNQRDFGPNTPQTQDMMNAPGMQKARRSFYCKNSHGGSLQDVNNYDAGFGPKGYWQAGLNPTRQFVGNYTVDIFPNEDGTATVTLFNTTSFTSFLLGIGPDWERTSFSPMGNMRQTYYWTEPIPDLKGRQCGCNK